MKLIVKGKTKDLYDNSDGSYTLKFKDDATGKDGVFDPGENAVGLSIAGLGRESLKITQHFFERLAAQGIPMHYLGCDLNEVTMRVRPVQHFGRGLEFVCRRTAGGSFVRRYGAYAKPGQDLDYLVEVTLKDDERKDPPITKDALVTLGILTEDEFETCKALTKQIARSIQADLSQKGLELADMKVEFGRAGDEILLIDEISAGCMRVFRDGELIAPMELAKLILGE